MGPNPVLTDYVATRWYRAPEILLGSTHYTKGVDIWSVGCILGEMIYNKPIFPGTSTMNQLEQILSVTGMPTAADKKAIVSPFAETMLDSLSMPTTKSIKELLPNATEDAIGMMNVCLKFSPNARLSADKLLALPYVKQFHMPQNPEMTAPGVAHIPVDDNTKHTAATYREKIYRDIKKKSGEDSKKPSKARCKWHQCFKWGNNRQGVMPPSMLLTYIAALYLMPSIAFTENLFCYDVPVVFVFYTPTIRFNRMNNKLCSVLKHVIAAHYASYSYMYYFL